MIKLYAFSRLRPVIAGITRDLRVLWALEECGLPYAIEGVDGFDGIRRDESYLKINPLGQLPVIDDEGFIVTESGAILHYLAEKSGRLMPKDLKGRTEVLRWSMVALNSVELPTMFLTMLGFMPEQKGLEGIHGFCRNWLEENHLPALEARLKKQEFIVGSEFTIADILLTTVLREIRKDGIIQKFAHVEKYRLKCEGRPAFQKVLNDYEDRLGFERGLAR